MERYDVIIAGASFAGLAVATQLQGRVLLIDPHRIGEKQTSACGTLLDVLVWLGLEGSLLQIHRQIAIHTPLGTRAIDVSANPFCTFNYRRFCQEMLAAAPVHSLRAWVFGCETNRVMTDQGIFQGEILVDATGWRRVVGNSLQRRKDYRSCLNFGLETVTPMNGEKLCFWFDPSPLPVEVAWLFPVARGSRVGVGSYTQRKGLAVSLRKFAQDLGASYSGNLHGGYFPARLGEPVLDSLFLVGDAAGQCLPLTGEGIRPAIYFGLICGAIIQEILEGKRSLAVGLALYRKLVLSH